MAVSNMRMMVHTAIWLVLSAILLVLTGCAPQPTPSPNPQPVPATFERTQYTPTVAVAAAEAAMSTPAAVPQPLPIPPVPDDAGSLPGVLLPTTVATDAHPTGPTATAAGAPASGTREVEQTRQGCDGGNCSGGSCGIRLRARLFRRGQ